MMAKLRHYHCPDNRVNASFSSGLYVGILKASKKNTSYKIILTH